MLVGGDGGRSGVPRHLELLLRACRGQARFVVLSERDRGGFGFLRRGAIRHITLPGLATNLSPRRILSTARMLSGLIRRETPDLVWAHARMAVVLLHLLVIAGVFRRLPGTAIAITYHGLPFGPGHRWLASALALQLERMSLCRGPERCLIFLSSAALAEYQRSVGRAYCVRHRLAVLGNSSDVGPLPGLPPADGIRRVLVTGRVSRQKNLDRALRIFSALPGCYRLVLCGEGTDSYRFRKRARRIVGAHALRRIDFAGPVEDVRPLLAVSDCFLLTSLYEGLPIGALEAFEVGLPLALSDIPGHRDLLEAHPKAVRLSDAAAPEAAVEDALRLVGLAEEHGWNPFRHRALCRAAWARRFGFSAWAEGMQTLLGALLPPAAGAAETPLPLCPDPPAAVDPASRVLPFPVTSARSPGPQSRPGQ
ncbi:glycosyltransferase family 4 protein [Oceanicola sp. S124]|uniref:glycosyltransferase family 4 protein n=1 Tax=Oceanicola sp. S124 TaxID=1042378 RepID=UPI00025588F6|nr:glycosyltransferase family 4 protein [Oceanicola sp. S124]